MEAELINVNIDINRRSGFLIEGGNKFNISVVAKLCRNINVDTSQQMRGRIQLVQLRDQSHSDTEDFSTLTLTPARLSYWEVD